MKKVFIGLLILAAGAGVYYLLSNKKEDTPSAVINKELLTGIWVNRQTKDAKDSLPSLSRYEFQTDGLLLRSVTDSLPADTIRYTWSKSGQLQLNEQATGDSVVLYSIGMLTKDSLTLIPSDSNILLLTRMK